MKRVEIELLNRMGGRRGAERVLLLSGDRGGKVRNLQNLTEEEELIKDSEDRE